MTVLGVSLFVAGCNGTRTSGQEDLGQEIVRGTLGAQLAGDGRLPIPLHVVVLTGQVTAVEGGAYVIREAAASSRAWHMTKILESIDPLMSETTLKPISITMGVRCLFRTLSSANERGKSSP